MEPVEIGPASGRYKRELTVPVGTAAEPTFDLDVEDSFPDDGLAISVEIPNDEEAFNERMMAVIKGSVIDPLAGIDVAADRTTFVSSARNRTAATPRGSMSAATSD